jgi:hypothetical protein
MPVWFIFSVFIGKSSPRTSLFEYIADGFYTFAKRNFLRLTWLRKKWSNHFKLLIGKNFVVHRKENMDKCLCIISIFYVNTTYIYLRMINSILSRFDDTRVSQKGENDTATSCTRHSRISLSTASAFGSHAIITFMRLVSSFDEFSRS